MATLRDARFPEEAPVVRDLLLEYQAHIGIDLCFQGFPEELATLPGRYARPRGRFLLAMDGDRVAGCVGLRALDPDTAEMKRLFVRPEARGARIGRALAVAILEEAREAGYQRVVLDTLATMREAIGIYRSLGFVDIPPYDGHPVEGTVVLGVGVKK